jgi:hypothetical protein
MIGVRWANPLLGLPRTESVDMAVSTLGEWLRYNGDTWLVLTEVDAIHVAERVRPAVYPGDNVIVLPIDPTENVGGFAPRSVWDLVFKRSPAARNALAEAFMKGNFPRNPLAEQSDLGSYIRGTEKNKLAGE